MNSEQKEFWSIKNKQNTRPSTQITFLKPRNFINQFIFYENKDSIKMMEKLFLLYFRG